MTSPHLQLMPGPPFILAPQAFRHIEIEPIREMFELKRILIDEETSKSLALVSLMIGGTEQILRGTGGVELPMSVAREVAWEGVPRIMPGHPLMLVFMNISTQEVKVRMALQGYRHPLPGDRDKQP